MFKLLTFPRAGDSWAAWAQKIEVTLNTAAAYGYVVLWSQYESQTLIVMLVRAIPPSTEEVPSEASEAVPTEEVATPEGEGGEVSEVRQVVVPSGPVPPGLRVHGA